MGAARTSDDEQDMSKPRVYVETTIPSFYHTTRPGAAALVRRQWTRLWWRLALNRYELVTSDAVLDELREGDYPSREPALALVAGLPILDVTEAVAEIVTAYVRYRLMPADPAGDALHLALASHHKCDFLVTWNCQHLANANKFGHLRRVNALLGIYVPVLATPLELLGEIDDSQN
jgi:predicted nucleic acid-binding protein